MRELISNGLSQNRACHLTCISRSSATRKSNRVDDKALRAKIAELHRKHPSAGYRVIHEHLKCDGIVVNHKKVYRIWTEDGHTQPRRKKRKRAKGKSSMPFCAAYKGHVWSIDFVHDKTTTGLELRYLTVIDEYTRECVAVEVRRSFKAVDVKSSLKKLMKRYGQPTWIKTDNGSEFVAEPLQTWLDDRDVKSHFIEPGSPWQNGVNERFNGTLRNEHLNKEQLFTLLDARVKASVYRDYYNNERLHSSLGYRTPTEFGAQASSTVFALKPSSEHSSPPVKGLKAKTNERNSGEIEASYSGNIST